VALLYIAQLNVQNKRLFVKAVEWKVNTFGHKPFNEKPTSKVLGPGNQNISSGFDPKTTSEQQFYTLQGTRSSSICFLDDSAKKSE
jgi:hypothetical protein